MPNCLSRRRKQCVNHVSTIIMLPTVPKEFENDLRANKPDQKKDWHSIVNQVLNN